MKALQAEQRLRDDVLGDRLRHHNVVGLDLGVLRGRGLTARREPPNMGLTYAAGRGPMTEHLLQPSLGLDLVRATVAAALSASRWVGRGDKEAADQAAVDAIRAALASVNVDGVVVATEGEKDEAPCFAVGERLGSGRGHKVDVAVDPIDGTSF